MPFKPNYNHQRRERERLKQQKKQEKQQRRKELADRRKEGPDGSDLSTEDTPTDGNAPS